VYRYNLGVALVRAGSASDAAKERAEALRLDPALEIPEDGEPII
jgi:hypothetical protein